MALNLFYITNNPKIALIAERYGVDRIWVDLETLGKEERQKNMNTVKSLHTVADVAAIKKLLTKAEMLVRVNPWNEGSQAEIDAVVAAGADIIMLPMWKTPGEVYNFIRAVGGRTRTTLLLETREGVECIDEVLQIPGIDEIHIGLNDLHLSYGMTFMFEPLANGTVEALCAKFRAAGLPYGFGGVANIGAGWLPAEMIVLEHYRLGSTRAILTRTFCNNQLITDLDEIERIFSQNMGTLRDYENYAAGVDAETYEKNRTAVALCVEDVVRSLKEKRKCRV